MPWCPKCKNEYKEGITVCTDCGCELREGTQETVKPVTFGTKEEMEDLLEFLKFSKINTAVLSVSEEEEIYELAVEEKEEIQTRKLTAIYQQQKMLERQEQEEAAAEAEKNARAITAPAGLYQNNAQKAEDNRSSAYTLLCVGGVGLIVMILGMAGVLPIYLSATTQYMVYGVMSALFILFIVMGVISIKSSKVFAKKAESENTLKDTMEKWCLENLDAASLDEEALVGENKEELADEIKYFKRSELIKQKIQAQFLNLDMQFLEHFTDEIYGDIFEEN